MKEDKQRKNCICMTEEEKIKKIKKKVLMND